MTANRLWRGFALGNDFIVCPGGNKVSRTILTDFSYWNYLQRGIGYGSPTPPEYNGHRAHLADDIRSVENYVEYLISLYENARRERGVGWQQPLFELS